MNDVTAKIPTVKRKDKLRLNGLEFLVFVIRMVGGILWARGCQVCIGAVKERSCKQMALFPEPIRYDVIRWYFCIGSG